MKPEDFRSPCFI